MTLADTHVTVATFGAPHGVRGALRLASHMDDPAAVFDLPALVNHHGNPVTIHYKHMHKAMFVIEVEGVTSREAAQALTRQTLHAPRDHLPDISDDDAFYIEDLVGVTLHNADDNTTIGTITAVHNFGAGDILDIQPNGDTPSFMLSFTRDIITAIDLNAGTAACSLPEILSAGDRDAPPPKS